MAWDWGCERDGRHRSTFLVFDFATSTTEAGSSQKGNSTSERPTLGQHIAMHWARVDSGCEKVYSRRAGTEPIKFFLIILRWKPGALPRCAQLWNCLWRSGRLRGPG